MPRETLVIEMNCDEAVGSGEKGGKKIQEFAEIQSQILKEKPLIQAATHLSPKYGLSGWVPLEESGIHIYAWDHNDKPYPPFVSVDVSTPRVMDVKKMEEVLKSTIGHFKGRENEVVYKTSTDPLPPTWREIAPHIIRQRMAISGILPDDLAIAASLDPGVFDDEMKKYMESLSVSLDMRQLSDPLIQKTNAWMHWETSGAIASWNFDNRNVDIDIYTCKAFKPEDAIEHTRKKLGLQNLTSRNY